MEKFDAIVEAGRTRFRPVILTVITAILGLIPVTTGVSVDFGRLFAADFGRVIIVGGESSQWWGPMGVAVIWGLAVATFLTLVVVPVMYSSIDPMLRGVRWALVTLPRILLELVLRLFGRRLRAVTSAGTAPSVSRPPRRWPR